MPRAKNGWKTAEKQAKNAFFFLMKTSPSSWLASFGQNFDQAKRDNTFWPRPNILHGKVIFVILSAKVLYSADLTSCWFCWSSENTCSKSLYKVYPIIRHSITHVHLITCSVININVMHIYSKTLMSSLDFPFKSFFL